MRSEVRESVFKYIFARLFNPSDEGLFVVLCNDLKEDDKIFATYSYESEGETNVIFFSKYLKNSLIFSKCFSLVF